MSTLMYLWMGTSALRLPEIRASSLVAKVSAEIEMLKRSRVYPDVLIRQEELRYVRPPARTLSR